MTNQIKLFAVAMQKAGTSELEVDCPLPATLADLEQAILTTCPTLADILPHCRFAVDDQFATAQTVITTDSTIAIIPPVSGGAL